jgi:hypothetical protein
MKALILLSAGIAIAVTSAAQAKFVDPPGVNPAHYQCYRVYESKPLKPFKVTLADLFGKRTAVLGKAMFLCTPVSKDGAPVKDKRTHLVCYATKPAKSAGKAVTVEHQFGKQVLKVGESVMLCLPSLKKVLK